jgi:uncharacterized Zn finger protein
MPPTRKPTRSPRSPEPALEELLRSLDAAQLREVVAAAAERHEDVERAVRLLAARSTGELAQLRTEVDRGLRTRRFLDYRQSLEWARAAQPILAELSVATESAPSQELVELLQRAVGHVIKVMQRADDSAGLIGDLARELLALHAQACEAGVADPRKLAAWMVRFRFTDQDFFEPDPVRYAGALGEAGLAAYRQAVCEHEHEDEFAARYARERLAVLDGDTEAIVALLGGNLTNAYQFVRVAEAMAELGRDEEVLAWTARGIAQTNGWQTAKLYDLACAVHERRSAPLEVLRLRRRQHARMPSGSTYAELRAAAQTLDAWPIERDAARELLRARDPGALVDALLSDGEPELAWQTASMLPDDDIGPQRLLRLAESREATRPAEALAAYWRVADEVLQTTDRRAYAHAIRILQRARAAAQGAGELEAFSDDIAQLRERHRRRPTLVAMLDKHFAR